MIWLHGRLRFPLVQSRVRRQQAGNESHALMAFCCWTVWGASSRPGFRRAWEIWLAFAHSPGLRRRGQGLMQQHAAFRNLTGRGHITGSL